MSTTVETATEIKPFQVEIPKAEIAELRRRIAATRSPTKELVDDRSQGVQLATVEALAVASQARNAAARDSRTLAQAVVPYTAKKSISS